MGKRTLIGLIVLALGAGLLVPGCATVQKQTAQNTGTA